MTLLIQILLVASVVLFILAGVGVPDAPHMRLGWLGAACAALALLIAHWPK